MPRKTFTEWMEELRCIVRDRLEAEVEELPEFDISDASMYFQEKSKPIIYFNECLSEAEKDGVPIRSILEET